VTPEAGGLGRQREQLGKRKYGSSATSGANRASGIGVDFAAVPPQSPARGLFSENPSLA